MSAGVLLGAGMRWGRIWKWNCGVFTVVHRETKFAFLLLITGVVCVCRALFFSGEGILWRTIVYAAVCVLSCYIYSYSYSTFTFLALDRIGSDRVLFLIFEHQSKSNWIESNRSGG